MGGERAEVPSTLWTAVLQARDREGAGFRDGLGRLARAYWKPVYWILRTRWGRSNEEAKDLAQAFFASFLEKDRLEGVDPGKGRFRSWLHIVLDNFMRNELETARALKRRGGATIISIDAGDEQVPIRSGELPPDSLFDRAWSIHVFREAVDELRTILPVEAVRAFERHELERAAPSCTELAKELGLSTTQVENHLKRARAEFGNILRRRVRETLLEGESLEDELRLLGAALS